MKNYGLFFVLLFALFIGASKSENPPEIHYIISATANGTATYISLEGKNQTEKYLYYYFDFETHSSKVEMNKRFAFFLITSEVELFDEKLVMQEVPNATNIMYGFDTRNWTDIKDPREIRWKNTYLYYKETKNNEIKYYYKLKRRRKNLKTLLLRIPISGHKKGSITVENILTLPKINDEDEKITDM